MVYAKDAAEASFIQTYSFLTFKSSTVAIMKFDKIFYVFDPHSRNCDGLLSQDGTAVLTAHDDCQQLHQFVENLCNSLGGNGQVVPFEMTHISISEMKAVSDSDTDFDGFSDVSEGEYSCLMFIAEETLKEKIRKIEEDTYTTTDTDSDISVNSICNNSTCSIDQMSDKDISLSDYEDNLP